jgi:hypothetical protein
MTARGLAAPNRAFNSVSVAIVRSNASAALASSRTTQQRRATGLLQLGGARQLARARSLDGHWRGG